MKKLYELETERTNVTPKQFFKHCKKLFELSGLDLGDWITEDEWMNPTNRYDIVNNHEDWDEPDREVIKTQPYEFHFYLQRAYNIILEFDFYDEKKGFGYMYAVEYQR